MENINSSANPEVKNEETLTAAELVRKHMKDPNHVITDDEFEKVKVAADASNDLEIDKIAEAKKEELENRPDNDTLPNPYTVVGS